MIRFVPIAALLMLGGCISFGPKAPTVLLTLSPATTATTGTSRTAQPGEAITVLTPTTPAAVATTRIPVYDGASELAYVKDTAWNDAPAQLFARLLADAVAQKTGRITLDFRQATIDPGLKLSGTLERFGLDPATGDAVAVFEGILARPKGVIETRRFEARVPYGVIEPRAVGSALNQAANDVAAQVADWVK